MTRRNKKLKKNSEIQLLIQSIPEDEYSALEKNIFNNGCLEPIIIWENTIIDGHKRYDICCKWNITFSTCSITFKEMSDIFSFVCMQQLHRHDLTPEYRKYLLGRLYQAETEIGARNFILSTPTIQKPGSPPLPNQPCKKYSTAIRLGKEYNISPETVFKYSSYTTSMDSIRVKEEVIFNKILKGKLKVSHESVIELAHFPKADLRCLKTVLEENEIKRLKYSEIRHELHWKRLPTSPPEKKPKSNPEIRNMPKYDPDAEVSSLALTIPSWISCIEHSHNNTDFKEISIFARNKLIRQLSILKETIYNIEKTIEEET